MPRFSSTLREHAQYPSNQGVMEDAELMGRASLDGNPPFISLFIALSDDKVAKATFEAAGCGVTTAVCSATTELLVDKTLAQCASLSADEVCEELEGVPPDKMHCVHVVLKALAIAHRDQTTRESL